MGASSWWQKALLSLLVLYMITLTNLACVGISNNTNIQDLTPQQQDWQPTPSIFNPKQQQATQSVLSTQQFQITQWAQMTQDQKTTQDVLTKQQQATQTAAVLLQNQQATQRIDMLDILVWKAGHETGNLDEWDIHGGFINQGSGIYSMVTPFAHTGNYAVALTIDTKAPSDTGAHAAYLFFWDQLSENAYYYSAWYYIPSGIQIKDWWSIWQWKSTYDGNSDNSVRVFSIGPEQDETGLKLVLNQRPTPEESGDNNVTYRQNVVNMPLDKWFQIEAFYKRAQDQSGQVIVWQDGVEIFNVANVNTVFSDKTIYWSVHNYTEDIEPSPCTIYIDDVAISKVRVGSNPLP
jgi:hypothetical protein